ncbi:DJ-1/PfpI family protein [Streptomyces uncialis]|uniref:DJ-1/PfpI family protein n=1 Tax=Streptomyces uncialis TaxID=1048205 RepID=UPI0033C2534C
MNRRKILRASTALGAGSALAGVAPAAAAAAAPGRPRTGPLRVQVVMFEGVEELDFAAPFEVLSASDFFTEREVDVRYVSVTGPATFRASHGTKVQVEHGWSPREADILVVPGGGYGRDTPGVGAEIQRGVLPRALAAARRGLTMAAVCTGTMLLSAAGLTRGRPCTTHHRTKADLEREGGVLKNARVVDDGDLVTAGGITSGLELGLWLVRRELGADAALGLEAMLEYEARGTVWTRPGRTGR